MGVLFAYGYHSKATSDCFVTLCSPKNTFNKLRVVMKRMFNIISLKLIVKQNSILLHPLHFAYYKTLVLYCLILYYIVLFI